MLSPDLRAIRELGVLAGIRCMQGSTYVYDPRREQADQGLIADKPEQTVLAHAPGLEIERVEVRFDTARPSSPRAIRPGNGVCSSWRLVACGASCARRAPRSTACALASWGSGGSSATTRSGRLLDPHVAGVQYAANWPAAERLAAADAPSYRYNPHLGSARDSYKRVDITKSRLHHPEIAGRLWPTWKARRR